MNYRYMKRENSILHVLLEVIWRMSFILGALSSVGGSYKAEVRPPLSLSFNFEISWSAPPDELRMQASSHGATISDMYDQ